MEFTHKTKEQNTFRFKSFADRVNEIDLRRLALYHIGHVNEQLDEGENETLFHQTLKKWIVLNLSEEFSSFSRRCQRIVTLPQLIFQKDTVIDVLLERLATATNLSLQPLLELLYVLARDLREEFYPYFQRALDRLICLLNTQDAEQLEWTLVCLAYLFKALKPYLKRNIGVVFHAILPLLDEQRYEAHITNFAVECFSFIARDVRDFKKFLDFVLDTIVREQVQSVQGCGRLIFEIIRGVKGQFHSTAGDFLQLIFGCLVDDDYNQRRKNEDQLSLLSEIIDRAVQDLLKFVYPSNIGPFWQKLCDVAKTIKDPKRINNLLPIILRAVSYRSGRQLAEMDVLVPMILKMFDDCMKAKEHEALQTLGLIISKIVLSGSTQVTQLDTSRLIKKLLTVDERNFYDEFVLLIAHHPQFELLVLPVVINYFEKHFDNQALELMTRIVLEKQPLAKNAPAMEQWHQYALHLKKVETLERIKGKFKTMENDSNLPTEEFLKLCILAPHIKALDGTLVEGPIKKKLDILLQNIDADDGKEQKIQSLLLLLETGIHLGYNFSGDFLRKCLQVLMPLIENIYALNCLDLLLAHNVKGFTLDDKETLIRKLALLLCSHQSEFRLVAAHCLKTLHKAEESKSPYSCIYEAALIQPDLQNYRNHLLHLQKLETSSEFYKSFELQTYKADVLRFLLGILHQNFKLVWEPILQLIEEYSQAMSLQDFWIIYKEQMEKTARDIKRTYTNNKEGEEEKENENFNNSWSSSSLSIALPSIAVTSLNQQELFNYRNLLWQRLPRFGQLAEVKNREFVAFFLDFVDTEYKAHFEKRENILDLLSSKNSEEVSEEIDAVENENNSDLELDEGDEDEEAQSSKKKSSKGFSQRSKKSKSNSLGKSLLQTLQIQMAIFVKQPNPKALYREPELHSLYMELLGGSNTSLQKLALDCVLAYKSKALIPNKEHLYAIIDEQKFKDELIQFKLEENVNEDHRPEFMGILLRILYGKMLTRGTSRMISAQVRKSLILRFLGQCSMKEILTFLHMAFGRFLKYTKDEVDFQSIPSLVKEDFNLKTVTSPRKLRAIVNLLEILRKEFGGIMDTEFHNYMLKLLIYVGISCQLVLDAIAKEEFKESVHNKMPLVFRNTKNQALLSLVNFFVHIENFNWQPEQMSCLMEVFVWPNIQRLPLESIHTPTPLLKLLLHWGQQGNLYNYLNRKHPEEQQVTFYYLIELLLNERAKMPVRKPLMSLVEHLLLRAISQDEDQQQQAIALDLVKPFIPQILQRLKMNFTTQQQKRAKRRGQPLKVDKQDLSVLSLLTSHVNDTETCENLLELLLPVLIAKAQSSANDEAVVSQVITTLSNLIKRLPNPETYLQKIAPFFEFVQEVSSRKMLCTLVVDIAKKRLKQAKQDSSLSEEFCNHLKEITRLVLLLNAWDKRWVEQPDYDKRLEALKDVAKKAEEGLVDLDLGVLVIYNCCYFLRYDKDMGLRDNAGEHLRFLLPKLALKFADDKPKIAYLVGDIFMNLARRLIRETKDNVRNEGIQLLGAMARQCPQVHPILADLAPLTDKHDEEVDFFVNLTHLQSHRHGRALLKFCSYAETLTSPLNPKTLTDFILPLASRYLLQEKYASKHTLIDAAIETVGIVCQLLTWQQYQAILRYYLQKLRRSHDYQKQSVRIMMRILDAFHFDLSQAQKCIEEEVKAVAEEVSLEENKDEEKEEPEGDEEELEAELEDALSQASGDENDDDENVEEPLKTNSQIIAKDFILKKQTLMSPKASKRILSTITCVLIPILNRTIVEKSHYDNQHKVNRRRVGFEREEEEILRVPIALAMVKLLQKLPKDLMDASLPGVFMKVCTFLRSPLKSVRMLTRDILKKIMLTLGSSYLPLLVEHLQSLLTKGFQVHVLSVTIHGVLDALRGKFQSGDIDNCLGNLLEVALNDIFGDIVAEKEVQKIVSHTPEAKPSAKSYLILHIAARNIREACLLDLLIPFKEHLARSHARKLVLKIQECFAKIVTGLVENPNISRESLLVFIYGTISESITDLLPGTQKRILSEKEKEKIRRTRPDCFIIQPAPQRRQGAVNRNVKSNAQANAHILIEFGLEMLHILLKRKKLIELDYEAFLNPLLPLLRDSLKSTHIRVTTFTLKCLSAIWNNEYELPEFANQLPELVPRMFEILKNLSTFGASKQDDNIQLVKSTLKALVALLRHCQQYEITPEQVDQLVLHIEQDLYEGDKQLLSFALLKALIARKVNTPAVHNILKQIAELSVTSTSDYVRDESRNILLTYVMEYALQKRVDQLIKNFSVQLCYSVPTGRLSAIQFLAAIIKRFPLNILSKHAEFLYLSLGTRLVNDEDTTCRKAVAECIESLIGHLEKKERQSLFEITLLFFEEAHKPSIREMAASLCSRFLNVEKRAFKARIPEVLPIIVARLTLNDPKMPGKFVRAPTALGVEVDIEQVKDKQKKLKQKGILKGELENTDEAAVAAVVRKQRAIDHEVIQMQYCVHKMLEHCLSEIFSGNDEALIGNIDELAYASQRLLGHEHAWVRSNAAKTISQILTFYDFAFVGRKLCSPKAQIDLKGPAQWMNFIYLDPQSDIRSLVLDLCAQMIPAETSQPMIEEVSKIFLFVANMLRNVPFAMKKEEIGEEDGEGEGEDHVVVKKINLKWLVGRIRFLVNKEVAQAPHSVAIRTALFNLIEGLIAIVKVEIIVELAPMLLLLLVREMSEDDQQIDLDLRQLALHVGSRLRKCIGTDIYDKLRAKAQTALLVRRAERKKVIAQEKIHDPVRAAKRKASMQERKKAAKKRKTDVMRGKAEDTKQKIKKRKRKAEAGDLF